MTGQATQIGSSVEHEQSLAPHVLAGAFALVYAWLISNTWLVTTGVQFVSPLAIILAAHLGWMRAGDRLKPGFSSVIFRRSLATAVGIVICVVLAAVIAPTPAEAALSLRDTFGFLLTTLACLAVLALVIFVVAGSVYLFVRVLDGLLHVVLRWLRRPPGSGGDRLNDMGIVVLAFLVVGISSLEGIAPAVSFAIDDHAANTLVVDAPPARVWQAISTATSPRFPLPAFLRFIPRPVAVVVDEGAQLGSLRVVRFSGREGEGDLTLKVTERTDREAVFQAQSDTSPIAGWVRQKRITFRVVPDGLGTRLTVTSDYDRLLSPAWFFRPYIGLAAYLAVNVLARDTKQRAEAH